MTLRKKTVQFAAGLNLNAVQAIEPKTKVVKALESVLARRRMRDILDNLQARSKRNFPR